MNRPGKPAHQRQRCACETRAVRASGNLRHEGAIFSVLPHTRRQRVIFDMGSVLRMAGHSFVGGWWNWFHGGFSTAAFPRRQPRVSIGQIPGGGPVALPVEKARSLSKYEKSSIIAHSVIPHSGVVESVRAGGGGWELHATAEAKYNNARSTVVVELDSRVQPMELPPGLDGPRQPWLPPKEVVKRRVPLTRARVVARKVFRRWTMKVRQAIPAQSPHSTN